MKKRTPFGTMLTNFRYQKRLAIDKVIGEMKKKHGADKYQYGEEFEIRESTVAAQDGSSTVQVELWKRVEVERVKISTSVVAEKVEDETKKEEDWI